METVKFLWMLIVGMTIVGMLLYWIYSMGKNNHSQFHVIGFDHDEQFCDDDDCDDEE